MESLGILKDYGKEIHLLFGSGLRLRIGLLLTGGGLSIEELTGISGSAKSSVINYTKPLIGFGLIRRDEGHYSLTTTGIVIYKKILRLFCFFDLTGEDSLRDHELSEKIRKIHHDPKGSREIIKIMRSAILMKILCLLGNGDRDRKELRSILEISSPALTPKLRLLENTGLIINNEYTYSLTGEGRIFWSKVSDFILCAGTIFRHREYLTNHMIEEIPDFALESLGDLYETVHIYDTAEAPFKNYENWMKIISEAKYMHSISNYCSMPVSDAIARKVYADDLTIDVIVSEKVGRELFRDPYTNYTKDLPVYTNVRLHVADIPSSFGLTVSDKCFTIKFSYRDQKTFDTSNGLVSRSKKAREWGERIYRYYLSGSLPVPDLPDNDKTA